MIELSNLIAGFGMIDSLNNYMLLLLVTRGNQKRPNKNGLELSRKSTKKLNNNCLNVSFGKKLKRVLVRNDSMMLFL
jgi:hypothetical protein